MEKSIVRAPILISCIPKTTWNFLPLLTNGTEVNSVEKTLSSSVNDITACRTVVSIVEVAPLTVVFSAIGSFKSSAKSEST
nr:MAG TPA: hypothetical protein [Caudoviricetes sp.]